MSNVPSVDSLFESITFQNQTSIKVPGKLFISGEYAILFPKQPAILIAVNQFLTANVSESIGDKAGTITTDLSNMNPLNYNFVGDKLTFNHDYQSGWHYVMNAVDVTLTLLESLSVPIRHFNIHFHSELVSKEGLKFGLGSSGAIVVATIKGLLLHHGLKAINMTTIFKLAALALTRSGSNGSLADIATIATGGWVYYQSFDRKWLKDILSAEPSVLDLLLMDWPDLKIVSLDAPSNLDLLIGWTQSPASTENLVANLLQHDVENDSRFEAFLKKSADSVERMRLGFKGNNLNVVRSEIESYRHLLQELALTYQLTIETEQLTQLIELSHKHQYKAKSSGAGGGDCGIAIGQLDGAREALIQDWEHEGIIPLPLQVTQTDS